MVRERRNLSGISLQENREQSARTLTLYPQRLLNTADRAHDAKGFSALDYGPGDGLPGCSRCAQIRGSFRARKGELLKREN
jgi:hypothetical protein